MADAPVFESPVVKTYVAAAGADLTLRDESDLTKVIVRADADRGPAIGLDVRYGQSMPADGALICGQRPGEWLVVGGAVAVDSFVNGVDRSGHVSTIDHTHARAMFRLTGARAASLLEKVCSIDWSDHMMPNGAVVSASVAKVGTDIIRHDADGVMSYLIACDRSFGQYLYDALLDAGAEFSIGVS